jgi:hypothetical protein
MKFSTDTRSVIIFVRHLGCPFCEVTIRDALRCAKEWTTINFHVVVHATDEQIVSYLKDLHVELHSNVKMHADPERETYAAWGVGEIGLSAIFKSSALSKAMALRKEGIKNGLTIGVRARRFSFIIEMLISETYQSRYQTNAAFALDTQGIIRFVHVAQDASEVSDLEAACRSLELKASGEDAPA